MRKTPPPPTTRWCHVTWSTAGQHKFFKIPALARFCERMLLEECDRAGWSGEALIRPDRIHLLLEVPSNIHRDQIIRTVRSLADRVAHRAGVTRTGQRVWERNCWCSVLSGPAVEAVRQWLRRVSPH